ncbi:hypothetical protein B0H16DRAFT_361356 [Mycena metata]|uniref:Uncharacterized protein n=1 Tax=Mycena metata TaxID=1033252 RepID=A0AAD7MKT3_9AGAR|nr:hypothetical protein B0H16DRAFT_361356 [Mycena metata]
MSSRVAALMRDKDRLHAWFASLPSTARKCAGCTHSVQGSDCGPIDDSCRCAHCRRKKTSCSFKEDYILYLDGSGPQPLLEPRFGAIPTPQPETAAFAQPGAQLSVVPPPAYPPTALSPVYPSTAPPPVYPPTTPPPVYPPTAPAFAQHTEAVLPGSSRMVEGPVAASDRTCVFDYSKRC